MCGCSRLGLGFRFVLLVGFALGWGGCGGCSCRLGRGGGVAGGVLVAAVQLPEPVGFLVLDAGEEVLWRRDGVPRQQVQRKLVRDSAQLCVTTSRKLHA